MPTTASNNPTNVQDRPAPVKEVPVSGGVLQPAGEGVADMSSAPWVTDDVVRAMIDALTASPPKDECAIDWCGSDAHDDCEGLCVNCWEYENR